MEQPNLTQIDTLAEGDAEFKQELLAVIQKEFPLEKQYYIDCLTQKKAKKTAEIVHKLKHKISILGLEKSYAIAVAYESALRENDFSLSQEFETVLKIISDFLKKL